MSGDATEIIAEDFQYTLGQRDQLGSVGLAICQNCGNAHHHHARCPVCRLVQFLDPLGAFEYLEEEWDHP